MKTEKTSKLKKNFNVKIKIQMVGLKTNFEWFKENSSSGIDNSKEMMKVITK